MDRKTESSIILKFQASTLIIEISKIILNYHLFSPRRSSMEPVHIRRRRLRRRVAARVRRALRHGAQHVGGGRADARRAVCALARRTG